MVKIKESVEKERIQDFELVNGVLRFRGRLCIPNMEEIRKDLLCEAHHSVCASHTWWYYTMTLRNIIGGVE